MCFKWVQLNAGIFGLVSTKKPGKIWKYIWIDVTQYFHIISYYQSDNNISRWNLDDFKWLFFVEYGAVVLYFESSGKVRHEPK